MRLLEVGTEAPGFSSIDQNGNKVSLKDYRGKKVILYFYPKDNTPGCTKEACAFRDNYNELKKLNVEILGVSVDNEKSHKKFAEKYTLTFPLIVDETKQIVADYQVWGEKSLYGKKYMGTNRVTYLIDEKGYISAVFPKVKPEEHANEILNLLKTP
ncbi:MAG: thioredoxin-dependent thiol peroxidase [Acidobacteriota bacterium]